MIKHIGNLGRMRCHDNRILARFADCRFWGALDLKPGHFHQTKLEALCIERLELDEEAVRDIVAGKLPIRLFNGIYVEVQSPFWSTYASFSLSMVWGDFMLYETGEPVIRNFVGVPESFQGLPPPELVQRVLKLLKAPKNPL